MKHFEEHSLEEILNLSPEGYTHPAVVDGKLVRCEGTECTDCDLSCRHTGWGRPCTLHFIEWLYSEVQEDTSEGDPQKGKKMKVKRIYSVDVGTFKVGDVIKIKLTNGVKVKAMAMKQEEDGMIFCLVDCLPHVYEMNSSDTNKGGYEESYLRKKLNCEIRNLFPSELKAMMVPFDNGDLLRLPTEREIFGKNKYGEYESPDVKQWEPMEKRKNRIAFDGSKDEYLQSYWLTNKGRKSTIWFCAVGIGGGADYCDATNSSSVRLVFKIKNGKTEWDV